jgi:hypothetical protein
MQQAYTSLDPAGVSTADEASRVRRFQQSVKSGGAVSSSVATHFALTAGLGTFVFMKNSGFRFAPVTAAKMSQYGAIFGSIAAGYVVGRFVASSQLSVRGGLDPVQMASVSSQK